MTEVSIRDNQLNYLCDRIYFTDLNDTGSRPITNFCTRYFDFSEHHYFVRDKYIPLHGTNKFEVVQLPSGITTGEKIIKALSYLLLLPLLIFGIGYLIAHYGNRYYLGIEPSRNQQLPSNEPEHSSSSSSNLFRSPPTPTPSTIDELIRKGQLSEDRQFTICSYEKMKKGFKLGSMDTPQEFPEGYPKIGMWPIIVPRLDFFKSKDLTVQEQEWIVISVTDFLLTEQRSTNTIFAWKQATAYIDFLCTLSDETKSAVLRAIIERVKTKPGKSEPIDCNASVFKRAMFGWDESENPHRSLFYRSTIPSLREWIREQYPHSAEARYF